MVCVRAHVYVCGTIKDLSTDFNRFHHVFFESVLRGYPATAVLPRTTDCYAAFCPLPIHSGQVSMKLASDVAYRYINVAECFLQAPFYVARCSEYRFWVKVCLPSFSWHEKKIAFAILTSVIKPP